MKYRMIEKNENSGLKKLDKGKVPNNIKGKSLFCPIAPHAEPCHTDCAWFNLRDLPDGARTIKDVAHCRDNSIGQMKEEIPGE